MRDPIEVRSGRAVVIHPSDNVAVAIEAIEPGLIRVRRGRDALDVAVCEPIPMGHKLALVQFARGDPILKYGEIIGLATASIAAGSHVHVHNLRSRRAGAGDADEQNDLRSS